MVSILDHPFLQSFIDIFVPVLTQTVLTAVLLVTGYVSSGKADQWLRHFSEQVDHLNKHQEEIISRALQSVVIATDIFAILAVWRVNIANLLLGAGLLGVIIGFASRRTLAAAVSGFVIMFSQPFEIGDWVKIGEKEGIVSEITIVNTHLRSVDGELYVIPNDNISAETITNHSPRERIRLRITVGVDYDTDLDRAIDAAERAVEQADYPLENSSIEVLPKQFASSSIELEVRFWIGSPTPTRRTKAKAEVIEHIKTEYDKEGITIPFPQRTHSYRDTSSDAEEGGTPATEADTDDQEAVSG